MFEITLPTALNLERRKAVPKPANDFSTQRIRRNRSGLDRRRLAPADNDSPDDLAQVIRHGAVGLSVINIGHGDVPISVEIRGAGIAG